ncbi:MAG: hypothetical protein ABI343_02745 [Burkholderiaceae bacterium]
MGFLSNLFGSAPASEPAPAPPAAPSAIDSKFGELDSQAGTRRELVRMLTRDTLRDSGIPDHWIESQILLEPGRNGQTFVHLQLVLRHWDERLLKYSVAFQRKLRSEVERIEPTAREWLMSIAWLYDVGDECPYLTMPDPSEWAKPDRGSALDREQQEMQSDLARLFAVRDAHLAEAAQKARQP